MKNINLAFPILLAFLLSCGSVVNGATSQQKSIDILKTSESYTRGLAGFAGHQFEADMEFERILSWRDAEKVFLDLVKSSDSTPAAVAYSFCGLKKLGSHKLNEIKKALSVSEAQVSQMHGDILRKEALSKVVQSIDDNGC